MTAQPTYSMQSLQTASAVPARTLRSWVRAGVLARPHGSGRGARYDESHLLRARVARQLRTERLSLRAIRKRMSGLSDADLRALLPTRTGAPSPDAVPAPPAPPRYPSTTWETVRLMDGLVLMVDAGRGMLLRRVADDIYRHYGVPGGEAGL